MNVTSSAEPIGERIATAGEGATVIVLNFEPTVCNLLLKALSERGYSVLMAEDADEALRSAEGFGRRIHLLIMDISMSRRDGIKFAKRFRAHHPHIRCLMLSDFVEQELPDGWSVLGKPFTLVDLYSKVSEALTP